MERPIRVRDLTHNGRQLADTQILQRVDRKVRADVQTLIKDRIWGIIDEEISHR